MISSPRPVGTIMNMYQAVAPRLLASLKVSPISAWLRLVNEELIRNLMPFALSVSAPRIVPSKAPSQFRKLSWISAVEPSSDRETILMSASFIRAQTSSVIKVPLVAMHMRRPLPVPYLAISKMSSRSSGSPPERTITGWLTSQMSSISLKASAVVKSPDAAAMSDEQRQWTQLRLHRWVDSQASHLGINFSFSAVILPLYLSGLRQQFLILHSSGFPFSRASYLRRHRFGPGR